VNVNDLFVQEAGGAGIPSMFIGRYYRNVLLALYHWPSRNFIQKKVVVAGFFSAAEGNWDKMNKRKFFASRFFLPNYSRERQTKARQVVQL